jgi:hypothetical protein
VATTFWRLAGLADDLEILIEGGEAIRFTHGDVTVLLGERPTLIVAQLEIGVPESVYELLRARAEFLEAAPERQAAPEQVPSTQEVLRALSEVGMGKRDATEFPSRRLSPAELQWLVGSDDLRELTVSIRHRLEYPAFRVLQLSRWLGGLASASLPETGQVFQWSLDGEMWHEAPTSDEPQFIGEGELVLDDRWPDVLQTLISHEHIAEPLAWQVFHEAVALRFRSPRAAFVLALTAIEVGIKLLPGALSPSGSEAWLALEMPTPRLDKLMSGYLPLLTERRVTGKPKEAIPSKLRRRLVTASELRNKLVHGNEPPPRDEVLAEALDDVYNFLYLLDWFSGTEWALIRVSDEWRDSYDTPD